MRTECQNRATRRRRPEVAPNGIEVSPVVRAVRPAVLAGSVILAEGQDDAADLVTAVDSAVGFDDLLERQDGVDDRLQLPCSASDISVR